MMDILRWIAISEMYFQPGGRKFSYYGYCVFVLMADEAIVLHVVCIATRTERERVYMYRQTTANQTN